MKKTAIITLVALIFGSGFNQLSAQRARDFEYYPKHEIYVQYGIPSVIELTSVLNQQRFDNNIVGKGQKLRMTGAAGFGYNFNLNQNVSVGLFGGISSVGSDMIKQDDSKNDVVLFSTDITNYMGMLSAHWQFLRDGAMEISSGVYLGAIYSSKEISNAGGFSGAPKSSTSTTFAYHITALKVRYGETFAIFGELGFGHRGILNVGLSIKF